MNPEYKMRNLLKSLLALCFLFSTMLYSTRIIVKADGTGDAISIQAGINIAAEGDTVLVSEGIWTGDILIENKTITLASHYILNADSTHIHNTIIDGEDIRTGIKTQNSGSENMPLRIVGFTVRNCRSDSYPSSERFSNGGGICVIFGKVSIEHCKIHHCRAYFGGGIYFAHANLNLLGNEIYSNVAMYSGGGLCVHTLNSKATFDAEFLNSIYLNTSGHANDIAYGMACTPTVIYLDKGSVSEDDHYFYARPNNDPIYIQQSMINQVNHDLWVSPMGDNANSGLSAALPVKTISYALAKIKPDVGQNLTVHVLPGNYSWSQNGESLPLQMKSYVNIIGESMDEVILDAEDYGMFILGRYGQDFMTIANLTLINGYTAYSNLFQLSDIVNNHTNKITVKNIRIKDSYVTSDAFRILSCYDISVDNLIIEDTQAGNGFNIFVYELGKFSNFRVQRLSSSNYHPPSSSCTGGIIRKPQDVQVPHTKIEISNFLITDVIDTSVFWGPVNIGISVTVYDGNCEVTMSNCTIANNRSLTQTLSAGLNIYMENCIAQLNNVIVSGNSPYEAKLKTDPESEFAAVIFNNSLVEGGSDSFSPNDHDIDLIWGEGNMYGSPDFRGGDILDPLYYSLSESSPCIDSGTPDISGLNLPAYDLAGNWRVWNNRIDMGCFEYASEPWVSNDDHVIPQVQHFVLHQNYPNPFNPETTISFELAEPDFVSIEIFNTRGQKIRMLLNRHYGTGQHNVAWDGCDEQGRAVSSGVYFYRMQTAQKSLSRKMLLLK